MTRIPQIRRGCFDQQLKVVDTKAPATDDELSALGEAAEIAMFRRRVIRFHIATFLSAWCWCELMGQAAAQSVAESVPAAESAPATTAAPAGAVGSADDAEATYTRVITERADKIVSTLGIDDAAHAARVRDLLVNQYRGLREIHDALAAKTAEATKSPGADATVVNAWVAVARVQTSVKLLQLHRYFVSRLAVELSLQQVDKVKDGMTYGVVQVTNNRYLELLPDLTDDQKREILAQLLEAREYAMDGGSSEEKHKIFGQYKGRINNYLSKAGYNLKQAERDLAERQKAASTTE